MFIPAPQDRPTGDVETVRLHDAQDLLTAVPYVLGFTPDLCLVVLALDDDGRLLVTARADLPDSGSAAEAAGHLCQAFSRMDPTEVLVVGYCDHDDAGVVYAFAAALPWPVRDLLLVDDDRWWSLSCPLPDCCPAGVPVTARDGVAAPLLVASGAPAASRADRAAPLAPGPQGLRDEVLRLLLTAAPASPADAYQALARARADRADGQRALAASDAVPLLLATADLMVRDACTLWADDAAVRLWLDLLPTAPDGWAAPVATLLAAAVYQRGDGVLAALSIERALADNPSYRFALLLDQAFAMGITPPQVTDVLRQALADHPLIPAAPADH